MSNAAPTAIFLGANDLSTRERYPEKMTIPRYVPKFFIRTQKYGGYPVVINSKNAVELLGDATFDLDSGYAGHQTILLKRLLGLGATCVVQPIISNAGPKANIVIYAEVLENDIPNYTRDSNGHIITTSNGSPVVDPVNPTVEGAEIRFVTEYVSSGPNVKLNSYTPKTGQLTGSVGGTPTTSTMYPIIAVEAKYEREYYNNIGFSIESPLLDESDSDVTSELKALTYKLSMYTRARPGAAPVRTQTLFGDPDVEVTLKPNTKNPKTKSLMSMDKVFGSAWYNETDPTLPLRYSPVSDMYMYHDNIETILKGMMDREKSSITSNTISNYDVTSTDPDVLDTEKYLLNMFTCKSSKNIPYVKTILSSTVGTLPPNSAVVNMNGNTPIFLAGGSDGDTSDAAYEAVVAKYLDEYADTNSRAYNRALNPESVIYDTGFSIDIKYKLFNAIGNRKDIAVAVGDTVYSDGNEVKSLSEIRAIAVALKSMVSLFPESTHFGTGPVRCIIVGGSGTLPETGDQRISNVYELAVKTTKMMAGNKWKSSNFFDHGPNAVFTELANVTPAYIPEGVKPALWKAGLCWPTAKDTRTHIFAALQTVCDNDTSVLNNWINALVLTAIDKIGFDVWTHMTGATRYNRAQFKEVAEEYAKYITGDYFGGYCDVTHEIVFTKEDIANGFSYRMVSSVYLNVSKTRMTHQTNVYRVEE